MFENGIFEGVNRKSRYAFWFNFKVLLLNLLQWIQHFKIFFTVLKHLLIQSGTSLKENTNTGEYDKNRLLKMIIDFS